MQDTANLLTDLNQTQDTTEMEGKYLTFWAESQLFGIPISDVVQIVQVQEITPIPEFPSYAKGIINLRGSIIPTIDFRLLIGKPEIEYNDKTCTIVANLSGTLVGFIVDAVEEVTDIPDGEISAPPALSSGLESDYLTGIGNHGGAVVLLLDTKRLTGGQILA